MPRTASRICSNRRLLQVREVDEKLSGSLGFSAVDLKTGRTLSYHGDTVFPQASSIKIPILIELFRSSKAGTIQLDAKITLTEREKVGGSGHLKSLLRSGPITFTVLEVATAMIETSDNTATNKLIGMLGMDRINRTVHEMGFPKTKLQRIMLDTAAAAEDRENISTPNEMAGIAALLYRDRAVDAESSQKMIGILKLVEADMRDAVPAPIEVASKPGGLNGVRCETGIIYVPGRPFALSVASSFLTTGENPIGEVTRIVLKHFQKLAASNSYGNRIR